MLTPVGPAGDNPGKRVPGGIADNGARSEELVRTAYMIEHDFRRLVDTLNRTIAQVEKSDEELLQRLSSTKSVAERGVRLGKLLLKLTRTRVPGQSL